ncbi:MAG: transposase [Candidatus Hatepunaea meridiana]|nr:transposase [Candidatus Hatepunaea meridiana]
MPKRFDNNYQVHFLTFSCYKRLRLFVNDNLCHLFAEHLGLARTRRKFKLYAFVIMPDHVHLLLQPAIDDSINKVLLSLKKSFSYEALRFISNDYPELFNRLKLSQAGHEIRRFWQAGGGYDRNIYNTETLRKAIDYIHLNPVRIGLVKNLIDWRWASTRFWILNINEPLKMNIPEVF